MHRALLPLIATLPLLGAVACHRAVPVAGACPARLPNWASPATGKPAHFVVVSIGLRQRRILGNGTAVGEARMTDYLRQAREMFPMPVIVFDPGPNPDCAFATRIRDRIDEAYRCQQVALSCFQGSPEEWRRTDSIETGGPPA
jgi:hypothetical protein